MRAREFIINLNIPVSVKINSDGEAEMDYPQQQAAPVPQPAPPKKQPSADDGDESPRFVPPLQQKIELMKGVAGKQSAVFDQLVADEDDIIS